MWRTKSSYTSEGWYRSIAAGNPLLASASPLLRFSFSRRGAGFPLARGRGCVRFFPPGQGRDREAEISFRSEGSWIWLGLGSVAAVQNWVPGRWVFALLWAGCRLPSCGLSACVCVCVCGDRRGCLGQRPSKMGARDRRFHATLATDWWEGAGSGVKRRSRPRTGQTEWYVVGLPGLDRTGPC
jgi:hypothetical protein